MIRTNLEQCVEVGVAGRIANPKPGSSRNEIAFDGTVIPSSAANGLVLNVKAGDPVFGWVGAEELEPGAGVQGDECADADAALSLLACIGNEAVIIDACFENKDPKLKGTIGFVTGKTHGRVLCHFPRKVLERLVPGDRLLIRTHGAGLQLSDYPDIAVANLSPRLLKAMNVTEKGGRVRVQVTKLIPGKLVGAGTGGGNPQRGHIDIQTTSSDDQKMLEQLRFGDLVTLMDVDASHGPRWQKDAITIGVVVHGASRRAGHGIGINVLMASAKGKIEPIIMSKANLAGYLGLQ